MKKLIYNCILLALSAFMCVTVVVAWFTKNLEVSANNMVMTSINVNCDLNLYLWDGEAYDEVTSPLELPDLTPGKTFYFKLTVQSRSSSSFVFDVKFWNISSILSDSIIVDDEDNPTKIGFTGNDTSFYELAELDANDQCLVNDQILYDYDSVTGDIALSYYKVEDTFRSYTLASDTKSISGVTGQALSANIATDLTLAADDEDDDATSGDYQEVYFALEFNEDASLVNGNSNCYSFQKLIIQHLIIQMH